MEVKVVEAIREKVTCEHFTNKETGYICILFVEGQRDFFGG